MQGADCWGWATWRRGWDVFIPDGQHLIDELKRRKLINSFDFNGAYSFSNMLKDQINGKNDSWAVRWHASAFIAGKLTLHPGRSLVHNIGNDASGTHCGDSRNRDVKLSMTPINLENIEVCSSMAGYRAFENFYLNSKENIFDRILRYGRRRHEEILKKIKEKPYAKVK